MAKQVKEKAANYSEADIAVLKSGYTGGDNAVEVPALATKLGKSAASVRAKLANMGLYVKAEKAEPKGDGAKKEAIASAIGAVVGLLDHEVEGLAKATKSPLEKIFKALTHEVGE